VRHHVSRPSRPPSTVIRGPLHPCSTGRSRSVRPAERLSKRKSRPLNNCCSIAFRACIVIIVTTATVAFWSTSDAQQPTETAMAASDFVDSIGVNTHFQYDKPYRKNAAAVVSMLADSGIRHIRDGAMPFMDKTYVGILALVHERGIRVDLVTDEREKIDWLIKQSKVLPAGIIDAYENPNELDMTYKTDYYLTALHTFTPALYKAVKADPLTSSLPVIAPSLTSQHAFESFGDFSAYFDYGNIHNYVFPNNPGREGSGLDHYGSIDYWVEAARNIAGSKPIMTTETGWGTSSTKEGVTEIVQLKYLQRLLFEHVLHGIKRTYVYQFLDAGTGFNTFGLVRGDLSPKPSYYGFRNLINLLADGGQPRRDEVNLTVDAPSSVHHLLLEKSDGRRYLAIWNEERSTGRYAGSNVNLPSARIACDGSRGDVYVFDENGALLRSALTARDGAFNYPVTDSISILVWRSEK
jgi:hypothetical protein